MDDRDLALRKTAEHHQIEPRGKERLGNGRRLDEAQLLRHAHRLPGGYACELGISAAGDERHDAVATPEGPARFDDLARELQPQNLGLAARRRVAPETLEEVGPIHSRRANADQQIARTRLRIGRLADLQHLRSTERLHEDGAHGGAR